MFQWLAKMLMKTPVGSSCACCEGRNRQLERMRREIIGEKEVFDQTKAEDIEFSVCPPEVCTVSAAEVKYDEKKD